MDKQMQTQHPLQAVLYNWVEKSIFESGLKNLEFTLFPTLLTNFYNKPYLATHFRITNQAQYDLWS